MNMTVHGTQIMKNFDPKKPYGEIYGGMRAQGAVYEQDGALFSMTGEELVEDTDKEIRDEKGKLIGYVLKSAGGKPSKKESPAKDPGVTYDLGSIETLSDFDTFVDYLDDMDDAKAGKKLLQEFGIEYLGMPKVNINRGASKIVDEVKAEFKSKMEAELAG